MQQAAQEPSPSPPKPPLEFVGEWGTPGEVPGQLLGPMDLAADSYGRVYIADARQGMIQKFDPTGKPLLAVADARMKFPSAITLDSGGAIYVCDNSRKSLLVFAPDGNRIMEIRPAPRTFEKPLDVAVNSHGDIFVNEWYGGQIRRFSPRGRRIGSFGGYDDIPDPGPGKFRHVLAMATDSEGFLFIADMMNARIQKFDRDGHHVLDWKLSSAPEQVRDWTDIATYKNFLVILDSSPPGMLQVWTTKGQFVQNLSLEGRLSDWRKDASPTISIPKLTISPQGDLFVLDTSTKKVLRFRVNF